MLKNQSTNAAKSENKTQAVRTEGVGRGAVQSAHACDAGHTRDCVRRGHRRAGHGNATSAMAHT